MLKKHYIPFVSDDVYFNRLNELADKLGVNRSECIRLMLDLGFKEYLDQKGPLLVVDDKKWAEMLEARIADVKFNKVVEKGLNYFAEKNLWAYMSNPELMTTFIEFIKIVTSAVKPQGAEKKAKMTEDEMGDFLRVCMKEVLEDYDSFSTEDPDPDKKTIKEAIKRGIGRAKGKVF